jgi:hypothetical protein
MSRPDLKGYKGRGEEAAQAIYEKRIKSFSYPEKRPIL